jgi:hypothetical protein
MSASLPSLKIRKKNALFYLSCLAPILTNLSSRFLGIEVI